MAKKDAKITAQKLFIENKALTREKIAETVGVDIKTLRKWVAEGNWEHDRARHTVTRKQLLANTHAQLAALDEQIAENGNVPTKPQSDAKNMLLRALQTFGDGGKVEVYNVFGNFLEWLSRNQPKHVELWGKLSIEYGNSLKD